MSMNLILGILKELKFDDNIFIIVEFLENATLSPLL